jgi:hypothetical protein
MASHWWRQRGRGWRWRCALNAFGALVTAVVLVVVGVSKFLQGAWILVLVLPLLVPALHAIGDHRERLQRTVRIASVDAASDALTQPLHHYLVIPVRSVDRIALLALAYVRSLASRSEALTRIEVVHVTDDLGAGQHVREQWDAIHTGVPMVILESPYRASAAALLRYLDLIQKRQESCVFVTVVLPETLPTRWWHPLLQNYLAWRLKWALLFRPRTAVTSVAYPARD